jgi:hypothetical protein
MITIDKNNRNAVMHNGSPIGRVQSQRFSQHGTRYWLYNNDGKVVGEPIMTRGSRAKAMVRILVAAAALTVTAAAAGSEMRIDNDGGGNVLQRQLEIKELGLAGVSVKVTGRCMSACTLVVVLPPKQLCFGPKAILGFHQATIDGKPDPRVTQYLLDRYYPENIRIWVVSRGGVDQLPHGNRFWVLTGTELWAMGYRKCPKEQI